MIAKFFSGQHGESKIEIKTRAPLKLLQMISSDDKPQFDVMSAPKKYGVSNRYVPKQNRFTRPAESSSSTTATTTTRPLSVLQKPKYCDKTSAVTVRSSKINSTLSMDKSHRVQSLMSSPKWSRIKDKFETTENSLSGNTDPKTVKTSYVPRVVGTNIQNKRPALNNATSTYRSTLRNSSPDDKLSTINNKKQFNSNHTSVYNRSSLTNSSTKPASNDVPVDDSAKCGDVTGAKSLKGTSDAKTVYNRKIYGSSEKPSEISTNSSLPSTKVDCTSTKLNIVQSPRYLPVKKVELNRRFRSSSPSGSLSYSSNRVKAVSSVQKSTDAEADTENSPSKPIKSSFHSNRDSKPVSSSTNKVLPYHAKDKRTNSKNLWVKDNFGNWTKCSSVPKASGDNISILRERYSSKFSEDTSSHSRNPIEKSKTESNVPSITDNKLSKSSTASSIQNSSHKTVNSTSSGDIQSQSYRTLSASSSSNASDSSGKISTASDEYSPSQSRNLSAVQRAVLSYEENLSLLSPETQRKLKLLGEKIKSQNAEDALVLSKNTIFTLNGIGEKNKKNNESVYQSNKEKKQNIDVSILGEPIQPVRNFLNRYQYMNKYKSNVTNEKAGSYITGKNLSVDSKAIENNIKSNCVNNDLKSPPLSVSALAKNFLPLNAVSECDKPNSRISLGKQDINNTTLKPNPSFLWRDTKRDISAVGAKNTNNDSNNYNNYYVLENFYSEKDRSKNSDASYSSNSQLKLTGGEARYQNIEEVGKWIPEKTGDEAWTDLSDEDANNKSSSSRSSTLKRRKNRNSQCRGNLQRSWSQSFRDMVNLQNSPNPNTQKDSEPYDSTVQSDYPDHLYEPVYESLGTYMVPDENNANGAHSLSPDDEDGTKEMYSSYTSLESLQSDKIINGPSTVNEKPDAAPQEPSAGIGKKATSKIRQLRRHLSWSKSDIKLELSSKFNKIKIKKNGHNDTEIGVRVQENEASCTSPKKNTFIKCILKQKSCNNIPVKKTPSPKKESALFYVHLSMTREKQRPFSDSCIGSATAHEQPELRKSAEPNLVSSQVGINRPRKRSSGQVIQRPKTPPPLPPTKARNSCGSQSSTLSSTNGEMSKCNSLYSEFRTENITSSNGSSEKGSEIYSNSTDAHSKNVNSLYATIDSLSSPRKRNSVASSTSYESSYAMADESGSSGASSSTTYSSGFTLHIESADLPFYASPRNLTLPLAKDVKNDLLKSPFEEEPLYQFYHKDVQQRATLWYSTDGSESELDDYSLDKPALNEKVSPIKPPLLRTQRSAMDLVHGEGGQRTLWCEVPEVKNSGMLERISPQDRKIQEAMFEVITSEASYLKSLNFLLEHFVQCPEFCIESSDKAVLDKRERHILFSDIQPVREVSASLLADLEKRWLENIVISNVCDIIFNHASKYFSVYIKYCSNQIYQERTLKKLKDTRPQFVEKLKSLESSSVCQGLDMHSFLMLPMQRITRLPMLVDAIFHRLDIDSPIYESCKMALGLINKLVAECNEGARKMERMEEMLVISHHLSFRDCKGLGLLSASRWLVKKGELVQLVSDSNKTRTFGRNQKWCKIRLFLFLFTDLLVITRKKSDDSYCVVDYCLRNMVQVMLVDENTSLLPSRLPSGYRNVFQLIMLSNNEGKTVEMLLSCLLESDRTRWMDAVTPPKSENPDEKIYEEWDCPQVQCAHAYVAQQPDELSVEEADVVNVFRKMSDGWYEGERIRDGIRGWFPSSHTMEIASSHVRARNLRQRYRLLMLSQAYLEEQKAQAALTNKK